ncbi:hypothetical protein PG993_013233 [Apiospora rasikravindrae]|uniref:Uncharacterized protein n=1 Tax=Apiospora rasikravindrae TaxID=990691 RepID=A0ABR1RX18_9PEZI
MPSRFEEASHEPGRHEWCPEFDQVRDLLRGYCQPFMETLSRINAKTDDITLFTDAGDPNQMPNEAADTILGFCRFVTSAGAFKRKAGNRLLAVIHDSDSTGRCREPRPPLAVTKLHEALLKPRFKLESHISSSSGKIDATEPLCSKNKHGKDITKASTNEISDANRRLVFVVNPDECAVWALAVTVSHMEALAMRTFISNYIAFKASFDVIIPTEGALTFAMSFHLPYYALRDASKGAQFHDSRELRSVENIGFLRQSPQTDIGSSSLCKHMYQAKLSCLVTGQDLRIWTAYMFFDNYNDYEGDDIHEEYNPDKEALNKARLTLDPFSGKPLAWPQITPREYFLRALEVLSTQADKEWSSTVSHIVSDFDATRIIYAGRLYDHGEEGRALRQDYSKWTNSVITLLAKLKRSLDQCVNAWESFATDGGLCYFRHMTRIDRRRVDIIITNFKHMSSLLRELEVVNSELMNITTQLGYLLSHESNEMANLQSETAKDVKVLTWVTFHSIPFTLAAAFLSTRAEILPLPETPATVVIFQRAVLCNVEAFRDRYVRKGKAYDAPQNKCRAIG